MNALYIFQTVSLFPNLPNLENTLNISYESLERIGIQAKGHIIISFINL